MNSDEKAAKILARLGITRNDFVDLLDSLIEGNTRITVEKNGDGEGSRIVVTLLERKDGPEIGITPVPDDVTEDVPSVSTINWPSHDDDR